MTTLHIPSLKDQDLLAMKAQFQRGEKPAGTFEV